MNLSGVDMYYAQSILLTHGNVMQCSVRKWGMCTAETSVDADVTAL